MIRSMTGYGRCEVMENDCKITVEMKSVNHRYLDMNIRMPKKLNPLEAAIRSELKEDVLRGKVDLYITYEDYGKGTGSLKYNHALAEEYLKYMNLIAEEFHLDQDVRVSTIARSPEVLIMEEQTENEDELWSELKKAVVGAKEQFLSARKKEGEQLFADLDEKLKGIREHVKFIEEKSPQITEEFRQKLTEKIRELLGNTGIDEGRILTETTIFADKICVDEEVVRLKSHVDAMIQTLQTKGSIGRKLDFIAQEMNREANTILSKTTDLEISARGIELKNEIEKVREQIQNIE